MAALKAEDGTRLTKRFDMERRVQEFYTSLFASKTAVTLNDDQRENEDVPAIIISEVRTAIHSLKADKAPGPDSITNEALKAGGPALWKVMTKLFNECLDSEDVPSQWKKSSTIIIPKKGRS